MDNRIEETKKLLNELQEGITLLDSIKDEFRDCAFSRKEFNIEFYNFFSKCNERIAWKPSKDFDRVYKKIPEYRKVERIYTDTLNLIERKKADFENDLKFLIETDENSEYYERELLLFEISEIEENLSMSEEILENFHEHMCEVKNINKENTTLHEENTTLHEENEKRYNQFRFFVNEEKSLLNEKKKKLEEITFFLKEKKASLAKIELEKEQEEIRKHELEKIRLEQEHELKKIALQLQIEETKLLREREEREAIHSSIQELHNTIKEKN